jgi:hypothetical protein
LVRHIARSPFWLFLLLTLVVTWPLAAHSTRSLASDYGDPLFGAWLIGWVGRQITRIVAGDLSAVRTFWDANIFYPEPNTLAFAEHLIGETIQVLPIYWATGNLLLCYNVALLLSFVLCGFGMCLLVADLTGSLIGGLAAGVFFAFTEYRLTYELSHLQTLSNHWLPFALLGVHRYIARGSRLALAGAAAAVVALNLSAGFHMLYGVPVIAAFALADLVWSRKTRDASTWVGLAVAGAIVAAATAPFVLPYLAMRRQLHFERSLDEVIRFSATLDQYRAALPGFSVPLVLALVACALTCKVSDTYMRHVDFRRSMVAAAAVGLLLTFWLSLGPVVQGGGHALPVPGLYRLLYDYVPGYDGIRAVARMATLFFFFLAALAGVGISAIESAAPRAAKVVAVVACSLFLWQTRPSPFPLDRPWPFVSDGLAPVPAYLHPGPTTPAVYRFIATLDRDAVLAEFPFGDNAYDLRYMYFSAAHRRRMLGGYSGIFPESFLARQTVLQQPFATPDAAWTALFGATHAIVHTGAWPNDTGDRIARWLQDHGAREAGHFDGARVFELRR